MNEVCVAQILCFRLLISIRIEIRSSVSFERIFFSTDVLTVL